MAKIDQCDKVLGNGNDFVMTAGAYKSGSGDDEVTRYKYGFKLDFPSFITGMADGPAKSYGILGVKRVVSVDAAGSFNKANDFGTDADADQFLARFTGDDAYISALAVRKREPKARAEKLDDAETLAIKYLTKAILQKAGLDKPTADDRKAAKAKAKELRAAGHKAYVALKKLADAEVAKRDKALEAADLLD